MKNIFKIALLSILCCGSSFASNKIGPIILNEIGVNIGTGEHQMTYKLTGGDKLKEHELIKEKYAQN